MVPSSFIYFFFFVNGSQESTLGIRESGDSVIATYLEGQNVYCDGKALWSVLAFFTPRLSLPSQRDKPRGTPMNISGRRGADAVWSRSPAACTMKNKLAKRESCSAGIMSAARSRARLRL